MIISSQQQTSSTDKLKYNFIKLSLRQKGNFFKFFFGSQFITSKSLFISQLALMIKKLETTHLSSQISELANSILKIEQITITQRKVIDNEIFYKVIVTTEENQTHQQLSKWMPLWRLRTNLTVVNQFEQKLPKEMQINSAQYFSKKPKNNKIVKLQIYQDEPERPLTYSKPLVSVYDQDMDFKKKKNKHKYDPQQWCPLGDNLNIKISKTYKRKLRKREVSIINKKQFEQSKKLKQIEKLALNIEAMDLLESIPRKRIKIQNCKFQNQRSKLQENYQLPPTNISDDQHKLKFQANKNIKVKLNTENQIQLSRITYDKIQHQEENQNLEKQGEKKLEKFEEVHQIQNNQSQEIPLFVIQSDQENHQNIQMAAKYEQELKGTTI